MNEDEKKVRAPRNRTITLSTKEIDLYSKSLLRLAGYTQLANIENRTINQDLLEIRDWLPSTFVDLLFIDPPYNLTKSFNTTNFQKRPLDEYRDWFETWFPRLLRTLKPTASVYIESRVFYTGKYKEIEQAIIKLVNSQPDFISMSTAASPR